MINGKRIIKAMSNINKELHKAGCYSVRERDRLDHGLKCGYRESYEEIRQHLLDFCDTIKKM